MKLTYKAYSPADDGELVAERSIEIPDDAGPVATVGALVNDVEQQATVVPGSQMRVIATRDGDDEPSIWHCWDHA